jgi:hypothetical protein
MTKISNKEEEEEDDDEYDHVSMSSFEDRPGKYPSTTKNSKG